MRLICSINSCYSNFHWTTAWALPGSLLEMQKPKFYPNLQNQYALIGQQKFEKYMIHDRTYKILFIGYAVYLKFPI